MNFLEINDSGNFETWNPTFLKELKEKKISNDLGQILLFENENVCIWEVVLLPGERLPFRNINLAYSWLALNKGLAISRYADGKIFLLRIEKGDSGFLKNKGKTYIYDLENKGEDILVIQFTQFKHHTIRRDLFDELDFKSKISSRK